MNRFVDADGFCYPEEDEEDSAIKNLVKSKEKKEKRR
jgi:hypothetical protein